MSRRRTIAFVTAMAFLVGAAACTTSPPKGSAAQEDNQDSVVSIDGFSARVFDGNTTKTLIIADKGWLNISTGKARLEGVKILFSSSTLQVACTSESANMYTKDNSRDGFSRDDIELEGDVMLTRVGDGNPMRVWTTNLRYNANDDLQTYMGQGAAFDLEMVSSMGPFRLQGRRFSANRALNGFVFDGPGELAIETPPDSAASTTTPTDSATSTTLKED